MLKEVITVDFGTTVALVVIAVVMVAITIAQTSSMWRHHHD